MIGVVLYLIYNSTDYDEYALFACMTTPAFYSLIDYGFQRWSVAIHRRDFYLWIRGSSDLWNKEIQFKASDRIFGTAFICFDWNTSFTSFVGTCYKNFNASLNEFVLMRVKLRF